jgi:magnesium-transporting ATPase (P-type)
MGSEKAKQFDSEGHVSGQSNRPMTQPAHCLTLAEVVDELKADPSNGLSNDEAHRRLAEYGKNDLGEAQKVSPLRILISQVANAMTLVLILAMAVSFGIKSWIEGGVVAGVILLNIVVGFFQEYSAERTMDSLRSLSSPTASVIRDGLSQTVASSDLVPGDLIELKTGDTIPADVR